MKSYQHIVVIYNPNSTGNSEELAKQFLRNAKKAWPKAGISLAQTERAGHAEELAATAAKKPGKVLVVSSSGDGGYSEVVNGVMKSGQTTNVTSAVLPAGNANDHSRTMHESPLIDRLKTAKEVQIDLLKLDFTEKGKAKTYYAHSYIGLGITPVIAVELNRHTLNAFKEMKIVLGRFLRYRPFKIRRGNKIVRLNSLLFANINQMAKVLTLASENKPDDGKFEVVTFPAQQKRKLVFKLLKAAASSLKTTRRETKYEFEVIKKMPIQLDGEVKELQKGDKVSITIAAGALKTLI
ncbi:MAG: diacylglycerol kinase [bacterium]|nr:diacylglycerol kinase [bacterium]